MRVSLFIIYVYFQYVMLKSTLLYTLRSFSVKEMREFGEFVRSPYFNKNQGVIKLFDYLKKYYPEFESDKLKKETVYKTIFEESEYNDGFIRTIMHILSSLAEQFLLQQNLECKPEMLQLFLTEELNSRKLEKLLDKSFADSAKAIEKFRNSGSTNYYHYRYQYISLLSGYKEWTRYKSKNLKDFGENELAEQVNSLASYFIDKAMVSYRTALSKKENITLKFDSGLIEHIMDYLLNNDNEILSDPKIKMHLYETLLYKEKSDKFFFLLKEMLIAEDSGLSQDDKYTLHNILHQYCVHKTSTGDNAFADYPLELYKAALAGKFYKGKNNLYFDPVSFPNIVFAAIKQKEFRWAEGFIEEYSHELSGENRDVVIAICRGRLFFSQSDFDRALSALNEARSIIHVPFKVSIKNLTLMIYYELSYYEQAEYLLATYKKFIISNRSLFAKKIYERQSNFLKYYAKLLKIKEKDQKEELAELLRFLNTNPNIAEAKWLVEKANELEK